MFYRFMSKLATQERVRAFPVSLSGKFHNHLPPRNYQELFKRDWKSLATRGLTSYTAPSLDWGNDFAMRFDPDHSHNDIPDLWCVENQLLVSEKAVSVIAANDGLVHDVTPFQWLDVNDQVLMTDQTWFRLKVRRYLDIKPDKHRATPDELGFFPIISREGFIARVRNEPTLRSAVERYPLWSRYEPISLDQCGGPYRGVVYLNQALVDALRAADVSGIDAYSQLLGNDEQPLAAV